jgi:hypothetical protein
MKLTKKQLEEIKEIEKKVAEVCDSKTIAEIALENKGAIVNKKTGKVYSKKTTEVTLNDKGVIINKETGKPHFGDVDIDEMSKMVKEKKSREIEVTLSYGKNCESLKSQLNEQGFVLSDKYMYKAEITKYYLHSLKEFGILTNKELWKYFNKLHKNISQKVIDTQIKEGEIAKHIATTIG